MINNPLESQKIIKPENISDYQFTLSLMNEGKRTGLLTSSKIEKIQTDLMALLSKTILEYTHNNSSSVRTETAEDIMNSLLYCIDLALRNHSSLEHSLYLLQQTDIRQLYVQGLTIAKEYVLQSQLLLNDVKSTRLPISLIAYNETIDKSFSEFFRNYNINFDAHNTVTSIDYPLLFDDRNWTGIIYIAKYLENLKLENKLCSFFSLSDINILLKAYGETYQLSHSTLLINLCELLLKNAVFSVLIGKNAAILIISQKDCDLLEKQLKDLTTEQQKKLLHSAASTIFDQLGITEPALHLYIQRFIAEISPQILRAIKNNALSDLMIVTKNSIAPSKLYYESGKKLSDEKLCAVIDELTDCQDAEKKAELIKTEIHNMEDLADVFNAYCIFDSEYATIFNQLGDYELAILASELLDHSPLSNNETLSLDPWHTSENKLFWQKKLIYYLETGGTKRYRTVIQLAKEII